MRKNETKEKDKKKLLKGGEKINISAIAKSQGVCWRTIDRRIHPNKYKKNRKKRIYTSILDEFKPIINSKLENRNLSAKSIYYVLIKKHNYKGSYETVKNYVRLYKNNIIEELTIRFNTLPGYQAQVDWKETLILYNIHGEKFVVNIFLMVLGYSRYKFIKLTSDREQRTLFICLNEAFIYFHGRPDEIIFDNMKTVIDRAKSDFNNVVYNAPFAQYAKDAGFEIYSCRPYRPRTKGKVESLAKVMDWLKAMDGEFETWDDLDKIIKELNDDLNYKIKSQATNETPNIRFEKEKEYLKPVNNQLLETYVNTEKTYKVSNESMIKYKGKKYSVPIEYIGKSLRVSDSDEFINIYYNSNFICRYNKMNSKIFNYHESDYISILENSAFKDFDDAEAKAQQSLNNLNNLYDINIEKDEKEGSM